MRKLALSIAFFLLGISVFCQESATIYRGRYPTSYPFRFNGTYYWETKQYRPGTLMYNGKLYQGVLMNVNAAEQSLQIMPEENALPVVLFRDQVSWFRIGQDLFVNLEYIGFSDAPEGFFLVAKDGGTPLLRQVRKEIQNNLGNENGGAIGYVDPDYDPDIITCFAKSETLYAIKDGKVSRIKKREYKKILAAKDDAPGIISQRMDVWHGSPNPGGELSETRLSGGGIGLPEGYFSATTADTTEVEYAQGGQQATYRNKVYVIGTHKKGLKKATVSGRVTEMETGLPLPGTLVYDDATSTYVRTDRKGNYSIELPVGDNALHYSQESKEETYIQVQILSSGEMNIQLSEKINILKEAVISASSMANHRRTAMGIESVSMGTVAKIPSAFGEGDILRAVTTLPGVKTVGEASGGFNVRGGSADENLILFNENTIYNPSHFFGIFSTFNPDIVDDVQMYKASVPAEYGGRLSSVMKVSSKDGSFDKYGGSIGLGVITARMHLEGPIVKGKTSFIAGGRTTYSNWILNALPKSSYYSGASAGFRDANIGLTHKFNDRNTLKASFYWSDDSFTLSDAVNNRFSSRDASLIFKHSGTEGSSFQIATGLDHYTNLTGDHSWEKSAYNLTTTIDQAFLKGWWRKTFAGHTVQAGANLTAYKLNPGKIVPFGEDSVIDPATLEDEGGLEPAIFAQDTYIINDKLSLDGGLRLSAFRSTKDGKTYVGPEFRLFGKYSPTEVFSLKGGVQSMNQYIHLISNTSGISPLDTWKLSDADIAPTRGYQASTGIYWTYAGLGLDFSAEAYWKSTVSALDYKAGAKLSMNEHLADDLIPVNGRAYGVEFTLKKPAGSLTGWISYSYSRSQYRSEDLLIAAGNWYNTPFDKPHEFKIVTNWALTHRYSFSFNVDYSTGRPVTVPMGMYYFYGTGRVAYSERNSHRLPDYFRVDAAFNIDPGHYLKAISHTTITIGVYNLLGRKNAYSMFFDVYTERKMNAYILSVFATQVPYVNLNISF